MPFFVVGLPRSRTFWFSEYFNSYHKIHCHHELQNQCLSREQFYAALDGDDCVGDSDSGLLVTDFQQHWPDAPTVIIERPIEDVRRSLAGIGLPMPPGVLELFQWNLDNATGLRVAYDDIDSRLREIHEYLVDVPYDPFIAGTLKRRNLQLSEIKGSAEALAVWRAA
jgi:hypothetical protein